MKLAGIRKIAVLRANAIGDFIFALPALDALREAYPDAEIVLLGLPWHADFLVGRPGPVDRVIVVPHAYGVREQPGVAEDVGALESFFADMASERFDLAVQMHGGGRNSNPFVLRLGARITAGLRTPDALALDRWVPYIYWQPEILRFLEVVALVGAVPARLEPRLAVTPADLAEAREVVPEDGTPLVAVHPGAGDPRRRWPADKFAAVGDALAAAGARVVVTGAANEGSLTRAVLDGMRAPAFDLAGRLSLGGLVGLLSRCAVVISNDSGPLHIAEAVGAATVGIYWCGNLINAEPITRADHRPLLSWQLECPECGRNVILDPCVHSPSFVAEVRVEVVLEQALELFLSRKS